MSEEEIIIIGGGKKKQGSVTVVAEKAETQSADIENSTDASSDEKGSEDS